MAYSILILRALAGTLKGYTIFMKKTIAHLLLFALLVAGCTTVPAEKKANLPDEKYYERGMAEMERDRQDLPAERLAIKIASRR